jgi:hypothetical protein
MEACMIRILAGVALGAGLVVAGLNLVPDRLPAWAGGHQAPLAVAATSLAAVQRQPNLVVLMVSEGAEGGRYELDLSGLRLETMRWDAESRTLTIYAPRPAFAGPGGAAAAAVPDAGIARLADEAARDAVQRMFLLPLLVAGHADVKVKVTFAGPAPTSAPTAEQD